MAIIRRLRTPTAARVQRPMAKSRRRTFGNLLQRTDTGPLRIFVTGGIGDWFVLESWMTPAERADLTEICFASPQSAAIEATLPGFAFPKLKAATSVWTDFSQRFAFVSKAEAETVFRAAGTELPIQFEHVVDWSIGAAFRAFRGRKFDGSTLLRRQVAITDEFKLPTRFHFIAPYSTDKRTGTRDFTADDWEAALAELRRHDAKGVVIYRGPCNVPADESLIDLTNKTTMLEAVEILKRSCGYIGIDTCFSVLAAQLFPTNNFIVKTTSGHLLRNQRTYYAPRIRFDCVTPSIRQSLGAVKRR